MHNHPSSSVKDPQLEIEGIGMTHENSKEKIRALNKRKSWISIKNQIPIPENLIEPKLNNINEY